ncbi:MAG: AAA family ATPase [Helicobacteraceae bacterium]|nr:AAA family ATPase [Helicobacteraceae bacterium]
MIDEIISQKDNLFITGGAGTGKSELLRELCATLRKRGSRVAALGSTGIAAVNIGGQTAHSFFGFGLCGSIEELAAFDKRSKARVGKILAAIGKLDLIMIDEISMISADLMDMIAYRLRQGGFGGRVILAGDFYQLPPVEKAKDKERRNLFYALYAFESAAWRELDPKFIELTTSRRSSDAQFYELLNALRVGRLNQNAEAKLRQYAAQKEVLNSDPTHLFGRNLEADRLNEARLKRIESREYQFEAQISAAKGASEKQVESFLRSISAPLTLRLKVGAPVLFTVNEAESYYNGERGMVIGIDEDEFGEPLIAVRKENGAIATVSRYSFDYEEQGAENAKKLVSVKQFPLRLAWAITIHKSQGMSILDLAINLNHLFEFGQFYVAVSRAIDPKRLYLQSDFDPIRLIKSALKANPLVDRFYELEKSRLQSQR